MGAFGGFIQTNKGRNLQAKAETGMQLKFTRMGIGDGQLSGQSIPSLNRLISEKKSLPITRLKTQLPAQAIVGAVLSNQDVTTGFYFREMGIFAEDPDEGEILYAYGNSGSGATEYISAGGTADVIEKTIDMIVTFGQAQNVSAVINSSLVYVTHEELAEALEGLDPDIPPASLTEPGIVQLSNAINSTSDSHAATPSAVKKAHDRADQAFQAGNERKAEVVAALVAIGIPASTSETWAQLIPKIAAVIPATGNATAADILAGRTASNASGPVTGSMPNRGAVTLTPGKSDQAIPAGYHNGSGKVAGVPVPAANVLAGTTIAGTAGTMPNRSAENPHMPGLAKTVWAGDRYFIKPPRGFYDGGESWVTAPEPQLRPENIRAGTSIGGIAGTLSPAMPANGAFDISNGDGRNPGTYDTLMYTIPGGTNMFTMSGEGEWTWLVQNVAAKIYVILKDSNNLEARVLGGEPNDLTYNIKFTLTPLMIHYPTRTVSISFSADQSAFSTGNPALPANFNLAGPVRIIMRIVSTQYDLYNYARCTKKYWQV